MTTVTINESAEKVLTAMREQVVAVNEFWGQFGGSTQITVNVRAAVMAVSLGKALSQLPSWGNAEVHRDDDLSLTVSTPHIFFGLIFHPWGTRADHALDDDPKAFPAPRLGRFCMGTKQAGMRGTVYCGAPVVKGEPTCGGTNHPDGVVIMAAPVIGEWSFHS